MGIEPTSSAWKAEVLPLNYTRQYYFSNLSKLKLTPFTYGAWNLNNRLLAPVPTAFNLFFAVMGL